MLSKDIRIERSKRLDQSLSKKIKQYFTTKASKEELLEELIHLSNFSLDNHTKNWVLSNCKNQKEILYSFKLLFQLGLNNRRTYSTYEDVRIINKHIDFSVLYPKENTYSGQIYTLGIINDIVRDIEIRCFTTPAKRKCGKLICNEEISIDYPQLKELMEDYNTYIKIYPQKPENIGGWELALELSIYSSIHNKALPANYRVLGGITEEGQILPIDKNILDSVNHKQWTIISNKNDRYLYHRNSNIIYIKHMEDIISLLKPLENNPNKDLEDFLCNNELKS